MSQNNKQSQNLCISLVLHLGLLKIISYLHITPTKQLLILFPNSTIILFAVYQAKPSSLILLNYKCECTVILGVMSYKLQINFKGLFYSQTPLQLSSRYPGSHINQKPGLSGEKYIQKYKQIQTFHKQAFKFGNWLLEQSIRQYDNKQTSMVCYFPELSTSFIIISKNRVSSTWSPLELICQIVHRIQSFLKWFRLKRPIIFFLFFDRRRLLKLIQINQHRLFVNRIAYSCLKYVPFILAHFDMMLLITLTKYFYKFLSGNY